MPSRSLGTVMKRRQFFAFCVGLVSWPFVARAQTQPGASQVADDSVGQIATLQGGATVTRGRTAAAALKISDAVFKNDVLAIGANAALDVTLDDETTLSLSANARIVVDDFVYEKGAKGNKGVLNVARGTVAFVASLVAKTGDMTITTPISTLGIRGTTGVVNFPEQRGGWRRRRGEDRALSRCRRARGSHRCFQPAGQEAWRVDARLKCLRDPSRRRRALCRRAVPDSAAGAPATEPTSQSAAAESAGGAPQQPNPNLQQKGNLPAPKRGGGRGERLKKLNPFAPRR